MWLIAYLVGAIEVGLITWLMVTVLTSGGWWYVGLIALIVYLFAIDGRISKVLVTLALTLGLALLFIGFGFIAAILCFIAFTIVMELFSQLSGKREAPDEPF
jgi:hypothetical protein